jgi:thymidylate kinase
MTHRREFISYFFKSTNGFRYCLLKFIAKSINDISEFSDIDLLIEEKDLRKYIDTIRNGPNVKAVQFHKKSFVTFVNIIFNDESYLEVDLIHRFDRKGIIYLDANTVLKHIEESNELIKTPSLNHTYEYIILFYLLNNSSVPQHYRDYFSEQSVQDRRNIFAYICQKYNLHINTLDELFTPSSHNLRRIKGAIMLMPDNSKVLRYAHYLRYLGDIVNDAFHQRGIVVTFSGVDGAGKSTVLENVRQLLQRKYRQKTIVLRHRPSILPILSSIQYGKKNAEKRASENLPRLGKNNSSINSFFRFMYYYSDYLFGQFYIYFRYTLRGYTVLYDRYYFDFIIDSRRSNIVLPKNFLRLCYYFIFKPQVNVFLYAPVETILSRKKELSENDISFLTEEYRKLFKDLSLKHTKQHYMAINNTNLEDTLNIVMKQCISSTF